MQAAEKPSNENSDDQKLEAASKMKKKKQHVQEIESNITKAVNKIRNKSFFRPRMRQDHR